ncbi:Carbohydrate binding domain-containing protein [Nonomuraea maritima]|uniref:Carbohydrate binding domain-containing protein n=1 Tax=Nonomuraea maritima TaxID=683260 RepID=A0A1G9LT08_9ACTN|nr:carbohydrate-binding protein [Nonomuraea maritima]SDL65043.1 Carbohydrate binding domain-containing protein [Nonomuraea maritima]
MRLRRRLTALLAGVALALAGAGLAAPPAALGAVQQMAPAWTPWTAYAVGAVVTYNGVDYVCLQAHTSQPDWAPATTPALWQAGSGNGGDTSPPSTPGNLRSTGVTSSSVSLAWNAATDNVGVTGYQVYRGGSAVTTVSGTTFTDTGRAAGTAYTYTVRARDAAGNLSASSNAVTVTTSGSGPGPDPNPSKMAGAPYLYMGWGSPPNPGTVMDATGIRSFTMAFILSSGGCNPAWDGQRPLTGGPDQQAINTIKSKGGSVQISFGGWSGNKLGPNCSSPHAFAGAVQQVINAVGPAVVDFDIENSDEFGNPTVQDRILNALKIVKANNPNVKVVVTFGTTRSGPDGNGVRLINQARALGVPIDNYTIMPFNFGGSNLYQDTVSAAEGLKNALKNANGWTDAQAYARMGISGMNGISDQQETTSPSTWTQIRDWAKTRGLTRLAYWAVNRDRPCPGGGSVAHCSGISQPDWEFTRITAGF